MSVIKSGLATTAISSPELCVVYSNRCVCVCVCAVCVCARVCVCYVCVVCLCVYVWCVCVCVCMGLEEFNRRKLGMHVLLLVRELIKA